MAAVSTRAALVRGLKWDDGMGIPIAFLDGDPALQGLVQAAASEWCQFANIAFLFGAPLDRAAIRISFQSDPSCWSRIGTDCLTAAAGEPTMNLGWVRAGMPPEQLRGVVLHEFGHVLGLVHEHQNPAQGIAWNKPAVYAYYAGPPNHWSPPDVDENIFKTYDRTLTAYTAYDPTSIMTYWIPPAWTTDGFSSRVNGALSATDQAFIGDQYPV